MNEIHNSILNLCSMYNFDIVEYKDLEEGLNKSSEIISIYL